MAKKDFKVGDKVRTTEAYGELFASPDRAGVEFEVTRVTHTKWEKVNGEVLRDVIYGDPWGDAVWGNYLEKVEDEA